MLRGRASPRDPCDLREIVPGIRPLEKGFVVLNEPAMAREVAARFSHPEGERDVRTLPAEEVEESQPPRQTPGPDERSRAAQNPVNALCHRVNSGRVAGRRMTPRLQDPLEPHEAKS